MADAGRMLSGAAAQPRRLALLALLVAAADRGMTRESLLLQLWPETDDERGRRALAQALYALRKDLGSDDVFLGVQDLRLNFEVVHTDLREFDDALATGDLERAAGLYRGPFLQGFHLPGANDFERWMEERRTELSHRHTDLLDQLAERATARGQSREAVAWLRRLAGQDPLNARIAARLMQALAAHGDVAGALQHARVYEVLVRQELDLAPDREVIALADRLRAPNATSPPAKPVESPRPSVAEVPDTSAATPSGAPPSPGATVLPATTPRSEVGAGDIRDEATLSVDAEGSIPSHTSGWATLSGSPTIAAAVNRRRLGARLRWLAAGLIVAAGLAGGWRALRQRPVVAGHDRVVAVGRITHYAASSVGALGQPLADMLATNLARADGMRVVSSARMFEVLSQLGQTSDTNAGVVVAAARRAGATELVDGSLYDVGPGQMRLDLRRVDLTTGAVLRAYTVRAGDLFTLADSGTASLVGDLGGTLPRGSLADVSTRSVTAYRVYEEGLRAYYHGDRAVAETLFARALIEDSAFAMAQFYYSQSTTVGGRSESFVRLKRAVQLAESASDRERLLIRGTWAWNNSSAAMRAYAETLMVRYPSELEGYLMAGQGAILTGDFSAARRPLHEVVAKDSMGLRGANVRCLACEAFDALAESYRQQDSLKGALRISRLWTRLQPASVDAWRLHAMLHGQNGAVDSARAAIRVADSLAPTGASNWRYLSAILMWENRFDEVAELARVNSQSGPPDERIEAQWILALAYRHQGRLREALEATRRYRAERSSGETPGATTFTAYHQGQVLFEQRQFRAAAALFDSIGRMRLLAEDSSSYARNRVWSGTHAAVALAALGDTARLAALVDTIQRWGRQSGFGRDRRLHYFAQGLLQKARGQDELAVGALRDVQQSPNGYTRINLELGEALLRLGRPREAVVTLQQALRAGFEGSNLYVTHTELHDRLAQAWEAMGQSDSAAYHYQIVARVLQPADPEFTPLRLDAAGRAMRLLSGGR